MATPEEHLADRIARDALALAREFAARGDWRGKAFIRVAEAAEVMSISPDTVRNLISSGTLEMRQPTPGGAVLVSVHSIRKWAGEVQ